MPAIPQVALNTETSPFRVVTTEGIRVSERRDFWEASARLLFGTLRMEMAKRQTFSGTFKFTTVSDVVFCRLASAVPHCIVRSEAATRPDGRGFVKAILQTEGSSVLTQNGRRTPLRAGEWSVYDFEQPYGVEFPQRAGLCMLLIPHDALLARDVDLDSVALRRFSARRGLGKLIWNLALETFDQLPAIQDRSSRDVADIIAQMIRLALVDAAGARATGDSKEILRERVKHYIGRNLSDPDLSIDKLAGATGCTKRYLHMAFQSEEVSISDYILRQRLERCREDLLDSACAQRSITEIAYSWGFNNSNHFSRCFKQAFRVSPRDLRAGRSSCTRGQTTLPGNRLVKEFPQLAASRAGTY
jgi:AraC-like DNA-binding protein